MDYPIYILAPILIVTVLIVLVVLGRMLKRAYLVAVEELESLYAHETIVHKDSANFFGLQSKGMGQLRGNGLLVLTESKLLFRMLVPASWIEIPLDRIHAIEQPLSWLGKSRGHKLLAVRFFNEIGEEDAVGWDVRDSDGWIERIRKEAGWS